MQVFRQIVRALKTPVTLLLLLAFVGYGAAWGFEHARAPVPPRPPVPCEPLDVGDTLTPAMVQVRVLNGGTKPMAKNAAGLLRAFDFKVIKYGNTEERLLNTVIVGKNADDPQVKLLTYFFEDAEVRGDESRIDGVVDVLLGDNSVRIPNPKVTTVKVDGPVCLPANTKLPTPTASPTPSESPSKKPVKKK